MAKNRVRPRHDVGKRTAMNANDNLPGAFSTDTYTSDPGALLPSSFNDASLITRFSCVPNANPKAPAAAMPTQERAYEF